MSLLDRKLWRDMSALRGQVISIALVVAAGVAVFVASISTYDSLLSGRDSFYAEHALPADLRHAQARAAFDRDTGWRRSPAWRRWSRASCATSSSTGRQRCCRSRRAWCRSPTPATSRLRVST